MDSPRYQLSIRVGMHDIWNGGRIQVEEEFRVDAGNFIEICQVLGRFHELAEKLKQEAGGK